MVEQIAPLRIRKGNPFLSCLVCRVLLCSAQPSQLCRHAAYLGLFLLWAGHVLLGACRKVVRDRDRIKDRDRSRVGQDRIERQSSQALSGASL